MPKFVVLQVREDPEGSEDLLWHLAPQVVEYESAELAAIALAPQPDDLDKPTRVAVIPWRNWHEYEIYLESVKGQDQSTVYKSDNPSISEA